MLLKAIPYALCTSQQVSTKPMRVGNFVLYRKKDRSIVCMEDVCPHRGARLSQGWTHQDEIVCPYHGWSFDENGVLSCMPSHPTNRPKCRIQTYPIVEDGNFVWLNYEEGFVDTYCPELKDPSWNKVVGSQEVKGNWLDWASNSWDVSHINFVHDFGDENNALVQDLRVEQINNRVVRANCYVCPKPINATTMHMQKKKTSVILTTIIPNTTRIEVFLKDPYKFITFTTLLPLSEEQSLLTWSFLWQTNSILEKNIFVKKMFENEMKKTIKEDERIIQHLSRTQEVSVPADAFQLKAMNMIKINFN